MVKRTQTIRRRQVSLAQKQPRGCVLKNDCSGFHDKKIKTIPRVIL